ncbi:hypothetical protein KHQ32_00470 [Weissella tructae]|nr:MULTISPECIES: DUF6681 family protein [Weissella]QVV91422.1 hypothetical protein KHQ32_00470 [Weissella tructae]
MAHLTYAYFKNQAYMQGALLGLAMLLIFYVALINFMYYFTEKSVKWDISPLFAKYVANPDAAAGNNVQFVPASGLYRTEDVLPALVISEGEHQKYLEEIVNKLDEHGLIEDAYDNLSVKEQVKVLKNGKNVLYANNRIELPFYRLENDGNRLIVVGGLNEMTAQQLGHVEQVGLQPVSMAMKQYDFFVATVGISGGTAHEMGRNGLSEVKYPYELKVELAYKNKEV